MYNWSHIDEKAMQKADPEKYRVWRLTAIIESDFVDEKLAKEEVKTFWPKIKDQIDPWTRRALEYFLWGKQYSLPSNLSWWNRQPKTTK